MLRKNEDAYDEAHADPAAPCHHHIMNMHTGTTPWIQLTSFEEYGDFLADAKGSCFSTVSAPKWCVFNPLTTAMAVILGFSGAQAWRDWRARAHRCRIIVDTRNVQVGDPIILPNVVLIMVLRLSPPRHRNVILCAKPSDGHWGTVDAGVVEVDCGVHHEEKLDLVGMGVVGEGVGVGLGLGLVVGDGAVLNRRQ